MPLDGIRAVCVGVYVPGPVAAHRLASFGARVTRIEPLAGDPLATWSPGWYSELREGQRVLRLDLKSIRGKRILERLLERADVLITALRPSSLERLGLAWTVLAQRFPRLVHVAIVGHTSPDGDAPGHDLTYQTRAGLVTPPHMPTTLLADLAGAERATSAALTLLFARERGDGVGRTEVSLTDAAIAFAEPLHHGLTTPTGMLGGGCDGYGFYRTRDGWLAVGALEEHFWSALLLGLDLHPTADRATVETSLLRKDSAVWEAWAIERGLPMVAVHHRR